MSVIGHGIERPFENFDNLNIYGRQNNDNLTIEGALLGIKLDDLHEEVTSPNANTFCSNAGFAGPKITICAETSLSRA